jgi:hypothetical protein
VSVLSTAAGEVSTQFDVNDYVPPAVQSDIATGETIYDAASNVAANTTIGPHGSIAISDTARQAITSTIIGGISIVAPELGAAYAILLAIGPKAGPGPGVCATNPPISPAPSSLVAWPYFKSWQSFFGPYPSYPAGTFEAFANPVLEYNWLLFSNCFSDSDAYVPPPVLLGLLINAWNSKHQSTSQRTITRTGLNANFGQELGSYDPIANALETALVAKYTASSNTANETFEQSIAAESAVPNNLSSSFVINNGPLIVQVVKLHLRQPAAPAAAPAPPSTATRVGVAAAIVVGAGALGVGAWALATHQGYLAALKGIWGASGGRVAAMINPLPLSAGEASQSTTVQTLLFPRPRYSESRAKAWTRSHGYAVRKSPDVGDRTIRIRQRDPSDFKKGTFRTISLGKSGVKAVVGRLR